MISFITSYKRVIISFSLSFLYSTVRCREGMRPAYFSRVIITRSRGDYARNYLLSRDTSFIVTSARRTMSSSSLHLSYPCDSTRQSSSASIRPDVDAIKKINELWTSLYLAHTPSKNIQTWSFMILRIFINLVVTVQCFLQSLIHLIWTS